MNSQFEPNNAWRRTATAIYRKPVDSKIYGSVELDVTDLEAYVLERRKQGIRLTLMHPFILFIARALKTEVPELNCFVRRGNVIARDRVDATVSVLVRGGTQMGAVRVRNADALSLVELADVMARDVPRSRKGDEDKAMDNKNLVAAIPWPFRTWVVGLVKWLTIDLGLSIPSMGLSPDTFGSFVFSNIGSIGLDIGYAALMPASNVAIVFTMGSVETKPVVIGDQIMPRRMLNLSAVLDHRVVDASHGGKMFRYLKEAVKGPFDL
ncbi:MAG: 2-oxo acid dehydrogenase subunit E2 [Lewinellaceae bacterium]|nr:2-oxo acid dehydrogenase subunit E2 [Lewinellaceae bacterium]